MDYAEAIQRFETEIDHACARADDHGLTVEDQVKELRRIAQQLEDSR